MPSSGEFIWHKNFWLVNLNSPEMSGAPILGLSDWDCRLKTDSVPLGGACGNCMLNAVATGCPMTDFIFVLMFGLWENFKKYNNNNNNNVV